MKIKKRLALLALMAALCLAAAVLPIRMSAEIVNVPETHDLIAYANGRWFTFNSENPDVWSYYGDGLTKTPNDESLSAAVVVNGTVYAAGLDATGGLSDNHLFRLDEDLQCVDIGQIRIPELGLPYGGQYPSIFALTLRESDNVVFTLVAYWTPETQYSFGIASVNLETCELKLLCSWTETSQNPESSLHNFYPISIAALNDGKFLVIEGRSNSLTIVDPKNLSNYTFVCVLPEMASLMCASPVAITVFPHLPQTIYYDSNENTVIWGASRHTCSAYGYNAVSKLVKIDLETGETLYDIDMRGANKPMKFQNWPVNCFMRIDSIQSPSLGDVNGDGIVNIQDAILILRYAMGVIESLPRIDKADVNGDGAVTVIDALIVMRASMY